MDSNKDGLSWLINKFDHRKLYYYDYEGPPKPARKRKSSVLFFGTKDNKIISMVVRDLKRWFAFLGHCACDQKQSS